MKKLNIKICAFLSLVIITTFMAGCGNSKENTKAISNSNKVSESSSKVEGYKALIKKESGRYILFEYKEI